MNCKNIESRASIIQLNCRSLDIQFFWYIDVNFSMMTNGLNFAGKIQQEKKKKIINTFYFMSISTKSCKNSNQSNKNKKDIRNQTESTIFGLMEGSFHPLPFLKLVATHPINTCTTTCQTHSCLSTT